MGFITFIILRIILGLCLFFLLLFSMVLSNTVYLFKNQKKLKYQLHMYIIRIGFQ